MGPRLPRMGDAEDITEEFFSAVKGKFQAIIIDTRIKIPEWFAKIFAEQQFLFEQISLDVEFIFSLTSTWI